MHFNARVLLSESPEAVKRRSDTNQAKSLLLEALALLGKNDADFMSEVEAVAKGAVA